MEVPWSGKDSSEALAKPSSDLSEIAVSPCPELPRMPRFYVFKMSVLRIDEETRGHCERRALRLVGQPAKAERPANPHRAAENLACEFGDPGPRPPPPPERPPPPPARPKGGNQKAGP